MGFFDILRGSDINIGVDEWKKTEGAVLVDVRTVEEYREGHIQGSTNIPLSEIDRIVTAVPNKETMVYVHCQSGSRSGKAVKILEQLGYSNVKNIGGLSGYKGRIER